MSNIEFNMDDKKVQKIKDILQSSSLNFLIGAGLSTPFLPPLKDIESRMNKASTEIEKYKICMEYFELVMLPNKRILDGTLENVEDEFGLTESAKYENVINEYKNFFFLIANILFERKSSILSKQANIFTTNIDILMEKALEESNLHYNDGFSGNLEPTFDISNFKKTVHKKSLHFENTSEIPTINLIKLHGSLTWINDNVNGKIKYTTLQHISEEMLEKKSGDFNNDYQKIMVVNPESSKLRKTVFDVTYYELLRYYSAELEKENALLFVLGFSMEDEHIREITRRSANSNPTLTIYIFAHSHQGAEHIRSKVGKSRYNNIEIVEPEDNNDVNKYNFKNLNEKIFTRISKVKDQEKNRNE